MDSKKLHENPCCVCVCLFITHTLYTYVVSTWVYIGSRQGFGAHFRRFLCHTPLSTLLSTVSDSSLVSRIGRDLIVDTTTKPKDSPEGLRAATLGK